MPRLGPTGDRLSGLRTSNRDRDQVINLLSEFYAQGRLDDDEYAERVDRAMQVGSYRELYALMDGLPVDPKRLPQPPTDTRRVVVVGVTAAVLVAAAGGGLLWRAIDGAAEPDGATAASTAAATPAPTAAPTPTPSPTPTPPPTPSPTPQAEPTTDPEPEADATPQAAPEPAPTPVPERNPPADPTVTPATRSGTGTTIVTVPWAAGVVPMIDFEVDRRDYEVFTLADADGNPFFTYASADGRGGRASGATVVPDYDVPTEDQLRVKVEAEGSWTITLSDVDDAPDLGPTGSGTGYVVGWYDGPEGVFSMSADAGNFAVWDDWRLIVNGIGPDRDEGIIEAGRRLLRIEAAAPWRYEIR